MSESNQEPTMEEILASIRRIISEDDAPAEPAAEPEARAAPELPPPAEQATFAPAPQEEILSSPLPSEQEDDDVLELTDRVRAPAEAYADTEAFATRAPDPAPAPPPPRRALPEDEPLIADHAADSAASAFDQLARAVAMPSDGKSLEDVVRELLRPLLKAWLDEHLSDIVQARVEAEVARIARARGR